MNIFTFLINCTLGVIMLAVIAVILVVFFCWMATSAEMIPGTACSVRMAFWIGVGIALAVGMGKR